MKNMEEDPGPEKKLPRSNTEICFIDKFSFNSSMMKFYLRGALGKKKVLVEKRQIPSHLARVMQEWSRRLFFSIQKDIISPSFSKECGFWRELVK